MKSAVHEIFHEIADLSAEARAQYFAQCNIDAPTRMEVEAPLAFDSLTHGSSSMGWPLRSRSELRAAMPGIVAGMGSQYSSHHLRSSSTHCNE